MPLKIEVVSGMMLLYFFLLIAHSARSFTIRIAKHPAGYTAFSEYRYIYTTNKLFWRNRANYAYTEVTNHIGLPPNLVGTHLKDNGDVMTVLSDCRGLVNKYGTVTAESYFPCGSCFFGYTPPPPWGVADSIWLKCGVYMRLNPADFVKTPDIPESEKTLNNTIMITALRNQVNDLNYQNRINQDKTETLENGIEMLNSTVQNSLGTIDNMLVLINKLPEESALNTTNELALSIKENLEQRLADLKNDFQINTRALLNVLNHNITKVIDNLEDNQQKLLIAETKQNLTDLKTYIQQEKILENDKSLDTLSLNVKQHNKSILSTKERCDSVAFMVGENLKVGKELNATIYSGIEESVRQKAEQEQVKKELDTVKHFQTNIDNNQQLHENSSKKDIGNLQKSLDDLDSKYIAMKISLGVIGQSINQSKPSTDSPADIAAFINKTNLELESLKRILKPNGEFSRKASNRMICFGEKCLIVGVSSYNIDAQIVRISSNQIVPMEFCGKICFDNQGMDNYGPKLIKPGRDCILSFSSICYAGNPETLPYVGERINDKRIVIDSQGTLFYAGMNLSTRDVWALEKTIRDFIELAELKFRIEKIVNETIGPFLLKIGNTSNAIVEQTKEELSGKFDVKEITTSVYIYILGGITFAIVAILLSTLIFKAIRCRREKEGPGSKQSVMVNTGSMNMRDIA